MMVKIPKSMFVLLKLLWISILKSFAEEDDITTAGSLQFDFKVIEAATDKFSMCNKLGQGGFGQVYKVLLPVH